MKRESGCANGAACAVDLGVKGADVRGVRGAGRVENTQRAAQIRAVSGGGAQEPIYETSRRATAPPVGTHDGPVGPGQGATWAKELPLTSARAAVHMARGRELAFRVVESGRRWRWVINSIGLVSALALAAGVYMYSKWRSEHQAVIDHASASVRRMELEIKYHAAGKLGELNERGWPTSIDTKWFEGTGGMPRNPLVTPNRPWVEVATLEESKLQDPVVRATVDPSLAAFWYNPYLGIVRARVPVMVSDDAAVQVYNRVNGARVSSIFAAGDEATPEQMDDADTIQRSRHRSHEKVEISATGKVVKGR